MVSLSVCWRVGRVHAGVLELQRLVETCHQRSGTEHLRSGGGQLDRQRQPIQPTAHLDHVSGVGRGQAEAGAHHSCVLNEHLYRTRSICRLQLRLVRQFQWRDRVLVFTAAIWRGRRDVAITTTREAAVDNSDTTLSAPSTCSRLSSTNRAWDCATCLRNPGGVRAPGGTSITSARLVHITSAPVTEASGTKKTPSGNTSVNRRANPTASLVFPEPPGPVSVTQPRSSRPQQRRQLCELTITAHQRCRGHRQARGRPQRPKRWKVGLQPVDGELVQMLGCRDVLELVRSQVMHPHAGVQRPAHQLHRR